MCRLCAQVYPDLAVCQGIVHVVDAVLVPLGQQVEGLIQTAPLPPTESAVSSSALPPAAEAAAPVPGAALGGESRVLPPAARPH